jgi:capsular polysaccharide biosynthesis protein
MNDKDYEAMLFMQNGNHLTERLWTYDDYAESDERPADSVSGLASLGFIRAALRRGAWLWRTCAIIGIVIGFGIAVKLHPAYQASTSLILNPISVVGEDPEAPITNEQALAQSRTVAQLALNKLGLAESVSSFASSYSVTAVTDRVLTITASAPSASDAVARANALATEFLGFRAQLLQSQQDLLIRSLNQQVSQARQEVSSIAAQITQLQAQPPSAAQQAKLSTLEKQQGQATNTLDTLEQTTASTQASTQLATDTILQDSRVLDTATPIQHSRLKRIALYSMLGLIAGLLVGLGIVVVRALMSDRLRRRDDVAYALGAPVKLSVGRIRSGRGRGPATKDANVRRVVAYMDNAIPSSRGSLQSLAVVAVDDVQVPAACLVSLAVSRARQGSRVVVADLCGGTPAARLLGSGTPGVRTANADGLQLTVVVPDTDDVIPAGPLRRGPGRTRAAEPLVTCCDSADLLLTLTTLDPSLGGEHLTGWASSAVVTVTAGRSSAARIRAVGEMIRLARVLLISGVLIGADKTDESLGLPDAPGVGQDWLADGRMGTDANGLFVVADGLPDRRPPDGR